MSSEHSTTSNTQPPPPNFITVLREMLRASDKVSDLIFSPGRPPQIDAMEQGDQDAMQTFDTVIERFIRDGLVSVDAALPYATNQNNLLLKIADLTGASPPKDSERPRDETSMLD